MPEPELLGWITVDSCSVYARCIRCVGKSIYRKPVLDLPELELFQFICTTCGHSFGRGRIRLIYKEYAPHSAFMSVGGQQFSEEEWEIVKER